MEVFNLDMVQSSFKEVFLDEQELLNSGKIENHVEPEDVNTLTKLSSNDEATVNNFIKLNDDDIYVMKALGLK